jgi:methyl-accepting chemotaxis protein
MQSLRVKLLVLLAGVVATLVACLAFYFPNAHMRELESAMRRKATTLSRMLIEQTKSSIAFDDRETAREAFESVAADADVAYLGLFRADGRPLLIQGSSIDARPATDEPLVEDAARIRVTAPVVAPEGPRGQLVVEFKKDEIRAQGARYRSAALGAGALIVIVCVVAWIVGSSFARRISAIRGRATEVAAGDLSVPPLADTKGDEIGQLARAFDTMVGNIRELESEIANAAATLEASCGLFVEMSQDEEARVSVSIADAHALAAKLNDLPQAKRLCTDLSSRLEMAAEFGASIGAGLSELADYAKDLRQLIGKFKGVNEEAPRGAEVMAPISADTVAEL